MMEHLNFKGRASQEELGRGLAKMHLAEPRVSACTQMQALVLASQNPAVQSHAGLSRTPPGESS